MNHDLENSVASTPGTTNKDCSSDKQEIDSCRHPILQLTFNQPVDL